MNEVYIPFLPEFEDNMKNGLKWMTTRSKKYGEVGDTFTIFGIQFKLVARFRCRLWRVAHDLYKAEGCDTINDFKKVWNKIHRIKGYDKQSMQFFFVHVFFPTWELEE